MDDLAVGTQQDQPKLTGWKGGHQRDVLGGVPARFLAAPGEHRENLLPVGCGPDLTLPDRGSVHCDEPDGAADGQLETDIVRRAQPVPTPRGGFQRSCRLLVREWPELAGSGGNADDTAVHGAAGRFDLVQTDRGEHGAWFDRHADLEVLGQVRAHQLDVPELPSSTIRSFPSTSRTMRSPSLPSAPRNSCAVSPLKWKTRRPPES